MEFQGTITRDDGSSLGTLTTVQAELALLFPRLVFEWSTSGVQKLSAIDASGIELPDLMRCSLETQPSSLGASLEDGGLNVTFNIGSNDAVSCIWVTVGGDKVETAAALIALKGKPGWLVK